MSSAYLQLLLFLPAILIPTCTYPAWQFQGKPFNITVIQVSNVEEAEVEQFYEDLQEFLELTTKKDVLFSIGDWNTKEGSQEIPGVTGRFGLGVQNEVGQRLTVLPRRTQWS